MHINHAVKGSLLYLHCVSIKKSNSTPEKKNGGNCNCCSQKSFYPIQVERPSAGELVQCLVEEESPLAAVLCGVVPVCQDPGLWGGDQRDSRFYDAVSLF